MKYPKETCKRTNPMHVVNDTTIDNCNLCYLLFQGIFQWRSKLLESFRKKKKVLEAYFKEGIKFSRFLSDQDFQQMDPISGRVPPFFLVINPKITSRVLKNLCSLFPHAPNSPSPPSSHKPLPTTSTNATCSDRWTPVILVFFFLNLEKSIK